MAIQNRRGIYSDFDPTKMVEGEFAVVQSGDPDAIDGKAVYVSTQTGSVEKVALYKDVTQAVSTAIDEVTEDVIEDINEGVAENVERAETAAENAESSAEEAAEILENKADIDGMYDDLYAGGLTTDKKQTDKTPYLQRATCNESGSGRIGQRCYDTIVGASVGRNQLYGKTGNSTNKGITFTNTNGRIAISGVNDRTGTSYYIYNFTTSIPANHVVAFRSGVDGGSSTTYDAQLIANGGSNELLYDGKSYIVTKKNYPWTGCNLDVRTGYNADQNPITFAPEIIDLTALLGSSIADYIYSLESATAGSGIAKLREWGFLKGYQAYNAGAIESVEVTGKVVNGFNQWDEEWEVGYINPTTGEATSATDRIRTKNFNPCLPNTAYYVKDPTSSNNVRIFYYDADKNFVSETGWKGNQVLTTPSNAYFFKFIMGASYGTTYNNDICINISSDRNGEYEAYTEQTYDYGDDTLNGIFKLDANNQLYADGDRKTSDGVITRKYNIVDLGTIDWTAISTSEDGKYRMISSVGAIDTIPVAADAIPNIMCAKYQANTGNFLYTCNRGITISTNGRVVVFDENYTDATAFKTAMNGVMLVYPLATETTEQSTPFSSPQVCYPDGTEEYVTSNGVPVGHETEYPYDLKGLVEELIDVPDVPSANGTYVLKATRSASGIVYNWVSD